MPRRLLRRPAPPLRRGLGKLLGKLAVPGTLLHRSYPWRARRRGCPSRGGGRLRGSGGVANEHCLPSRSHRKARTARRTCAACKRRRPRGTRVGSRSDRCSRLRYPNGPGSRLVTEEVLLVSCIENTRGLTRVGAALGRSSTREGSSQLSSNA